MLLKLHVDDNTSRTLAKKFLATAMLMVVIPPALIFYQNHHLQLSCLFLLSCFIKGFAGARITYSVGYHASVCFHVEMLLINTNTRGVYVLLSDNLSRTRATREEGENMEEDG